MSKYLIKLKPIDKFYFGSIDSFGKDNNNDYVLFSNKFPQQTSVLGMLRKEVLIQSGLLKIDKNYSSEEKDKLEKVIGGKSFDMENENDFGKIKSISSTFIENNNNFFIVTPKNHKVNEKKYSKMEIDTNKNKRINKSSVEIEFLKDYKAKDGLENSFTNISDGKIIKFDNIYKKITDIGIRKNKDEKSFFKKMKYKFKKGYTFAFNADIDFELTDSIVQVGDKFSFFEMKVEKVDKTILKKIKIDKSETEIIFLSDGIINLKELDYKFGIIDSVKFKNWKTKTGDYKFKRNDEVYNLVKKGTVLYCNENKDKIVNKIKENLNYTKIGFNEIY